jgi:hypothetical protein
MNRTLPKRSSLILSLFAGVLSLTAEARAATEVFTLAPGLHYTYSYVSRSSSYNILEGTLVNRDSGTVGYVVQDSSVVTDSTVVWHVLQISMLQHTVQGRGQDSLWWIHDSVDISVTETTAGLHPLAATGIVWNFPVTNIWGICNFPPQPVYRYATTDTTRVVIGSNCEGRGELLDTLCFSSTSGYYRRDFTWHASLGMTTFGGIIAVRQLSLVLAIEPETDLPESFELRQNYPNPFNPYTTITYTVPRAQEVTILVYDVLGREVASLVNGRKSAGEHRVTFDASGLSSGVYVYRMQTERFAQSKKLMILK